MLSAEIIAAIAAGIATIMGANFALIKWLVSKFLSELKPNGGSSLKDQVNRLEKRVDDIYHILAELNTKKTRTKK
jgi:citrate synthase